jgi:HAD superfamily hydrolase (TIGR01509 family)
MSLDPARVRALCFDVDGTLSDTDDYYANRISRWLRRVPFTGDPNRLARCLVMWMESPGNALLALADAIGLGTPIMVLINWMYRHRKRHSQPPPVVPGVVEMLDAVRGRYPMAIVSSRDEQGTMAFLQARDLVQYFPVIITALSARRTKPYPDPVCLAAQTMKVAPEACLMVGDTTVDIRSGRSAGAQTVGVLCGFGEEAELRRQGADSILCTTAQLAGLLL